MTTPLQPPHQRLPDRAAGAGDEYPQRPAILRGWGATLLHALASGSAASIACTAVVTAFARHRTGDGASGTNATSHWIWGRRAQRQRGASLRHTAVGYGIHHASSVWWALAFERMTQRTRSPRAIVGSAAAVAAMAWFVDYKVVPRRLTPGFESRLRGGDMVLAYTAFAAGLAAVRLWRARRLTPHGARPSAPPAPRAVPAPRAPRRG